MKIFIPGNVPSLKNEKGIGRGRMFESKRMTDYIKLSAKHWHENRDIFLEAIDKSNIKPVFIHLTFVRKSKHKFDYINPTETIQDLMRDFLWIEDDNADLIVPVFGRYLYDKDNPGVYIRILKSYPIYEFM